MKLIAIPGFLCGGVVGFAAGCLAAYLMALWAVWDNPDDSSAGSVAIVVIATGPLAAMFGSVGGVLLALCAPHLFSYTILPLAVLLVALVATHSILSGIDRPRSFVVEVNGTPGAAYEAYVVIDGKPQRRKGSIPERFETRCRYLTMAFALAAPGDRRLIKVRVFADGTELPGGYESVVGMFLAYEAHGISETFGGTSSSWSDMSPEEAKPFLEGERPRELF